MTAFSISGPGSNDPRIWGLDTLRFVAAAFVVFSHCGYPPLTVGLDRANSFALFIQGLYGNIFPGVPAVIVFFVISGFCIHYPYRSTASFALVPYFTRRYLRICVPFIVVVLLAGPLHVKLTLFQNSVLWSLLAELIYYTLYPLLRCLRQRAGWTWIIAGSFVAAYAVVLCFPTAKDYSPFGPPLAGLVAFPCWLLGCKLAEVNFGALDGNGAAAHVWFWRAGVWFLAWACSALRFHSPLGYPWTLNFFAVAVFFWLRVEIAASNYRQGSRWLEWAGRWSYSIYLVHMIANAAHDLLPLPNLGYNLNWCLRMAFIFSASYVFFLLIEVPSHFVARHLGRWFTNGRRPSLSV